MKFSIAKSIFNKFTMTFIVVAACIFASLSQCASSQNAPDKQASFEWDLAVENHTGMSKDLYINDGLHRGMSVFNLRNKEQDAINQLVKNNIEWVALIPYYYQPTDTTKTMRLPSSLEGWSRRDSFFIEGIHKIHARNMHVHLKPHLWMEKGWRSDIKLDSDEEWDRWFDSYEINILRHARMAEQFDVELLCIGAEFRSSIEKQPHRWEQLVKDIRQIYDGKLTYAANWDGEFDKVTFWDQMDYIGIQAYFPLTENKEPQLNQILNGWNKHTKVLKELSKKHNKPILFTEVGYRSDDAATIEPWVWGSVDSEEVSNKLSTQTQNLAYEALFQKMWHEEWFAGVYFWQWHIRSKEGDKYEEMNFSPRFKPAENTMAKWFGAETQ